MQRCAAPCSVRRDVLTVTPHGRPAWDLDGGQFGMPGLQQKSACCMRKSEQRHLHGRDDARCVRPRDRRVRRPCYAAPCVGLCCVGQGTFGQPETTSQVAAMPSAAPLTPANADPPPALQYKVSVVGTLPNGSNTPPSNTLKFVTPARGAPVVAGKASAPTKAAITVRPPPGGPWSKYSLSLCPIGGPRSKCIKVSCPASEKPSFCPVDGLTPSTTYVAKASGAGVLCCAAPRLSTAGVRCTVHVMLSVACQLQSSGLLAQSERFTARRGHAVAPAISPDPPPPPPPLWLQAVALAPDGTESLPSNEAIFTTPDQPKLG